MVLITYVEPSGSEVELNVEDGWSLMHAAVTNGVDGIVAECGGSCVCATCHVYVNEVWLGKLAPRTADEDDLLDGAAAERRPNSRLSCQIKITTDLDGLVLRLPDRQI